MYQKETYKTRYALGIILYYCQAHGAVSASGISNSDGDQCYYRVEYSSKRLNLPLRLFKLGEQSKCNHKKGCFVCFLVSSLIIFSRHAVFHTPQ